MIQNEVVQWIVLTPLQICGELRDILLSPGPKSTGLVAERARIPVEKSGGGV